jgi:hypothetical protein
MSLTIEQKHFEEAQILKKTKPGFIFEHVRITIISRS